MRILVMALGRRRALPVYAYEMAHALSKICDVSVVVAEGAENIQKWRQLPIKRLEIKTYKDHNHISGFFSLFKFYTFFKIRQFIKKSKADVIYYPFPHLWKLILDYWKPFNIPVIMTIHDPILHEGEKTFADKLIFWIALRNVDFFILLNKTQRDFFVNKYKINASNVCNVPHGVYSSYVESLKEIEEIPKIKELIKVKNRYFLFIGRLLKYKGLATLLKAFKMLLSSDSNIILVIAGGGNLSEEERELFSLISKSGRVYFYNHFLNDAEMATLVKNAYMTILPYDFATQSGIIALSFAFGTPAIVSRVGGLEEQVKDEETGYLFTPGNEGELVQKILLAWKLPPHQYEDMRERCLNYANKYWSWDSIAETLVLFLENHIKEA